MIETTIDIVLEDAPATASINGRRYYRFLPNGYLWELADVNFYKDTSSAAAADSYVWSLCRASDDAVMASVATTSALLQYNAMTKSSTTSYLTVDASGTNPVYVYASCANSGVGATMGEGMRIVARFKARKPGVAA